MAQIFDWVTLLSIDISLVIRLNGLTCKRRLLVIDKSFPLLIGKRFKRSIFIGWAIKRFISVRFTTGFSETLMNSYYWLNDKGFLKTDKTRFKRPFFGVFVWFMVRFGLVFISFVYRFR